MNLTPRLKTIYEMIGSTQSMADIGTDHGFLPIALLENGKCDRAIMTDISAGSLQKAKVNAGAYQFGGRVSFRLGNGLEVMEKGEVRVVVMAGMGSKLMIALLEKDKSKTFSMGRYIFQPRKNTELLRKWLYDNDFAVTEEALVKENKHICEIISAVPKSAGKDAKDLLSHPDFNADCPAMWEMPPYLSHWGDLYRRLAAKKLRSAETVRRGLEKGRADFELIDAAREKEEYFRKITEDEI